MLVLAVLIVVIVVVMVVLCILHHCEKVEKDDDEEEYQVCGVMQFDDALERAVFLKKPPFKKNQTVNININDVKNTGGKFKQKITEIFNRDVAPHVNLKFNFANKPSASGAMITISNNDASLIEKGFNGITKGMGKQLVSIDIRDGTPDRTVIHEFGHGFGLAHEHSHPDFAKKLDVNKLIDAKIASNPNLSQAAAAEIVTKGATQENVPVMIKIFKHVFKNFIYSLF